MIGPPKNFSLAGTWLALAAMLTLVACRPSTVPAPPPIGAELIINGGFEKPLTPHDSFPAGKAPPAPQSSGGSTHIQSLAAGAPIPEFGWTIEEKRVTLMGYGYDSGGGNVLMGHMAQGDQCLQLNGRSPGPISQTFATEVGTVYSLSFAYANNPDPDASASCPFQGKVVVVDKASGKDLVPPLVFIHKNSTLADYRWVHAVPLIFTATGDHTTIRFSSLEGPAFQWGIFIDAVSVKVVSRPGLFDRIGPAF